MTIIKCIKTKNTHILNQDQSVKYQSRFKQRPVRNPGHNSIMVSCGIGKTGHTTEYNFVYQEKMSECSRI